jgi:hypothetical protein
MSGTAQPPRGGRHRSGRRTVAAALPSVLAVVAVVGLVLVVLAWRGRGGDAVGAEAAGRLTPPAFATNEAANPTPTTHPVSAPPATSPPPAPVTPTPTPVTEPEPGAATPAATVAPPVQHSVRAAVAVLNEPRRSGLAARVAARLAAGGWTVQRVANFRGTVPATTVYYGPGLDNAALELAADVGAMRVRPAFAGLDQHRLTVVLTADFGG